ncbi:MAG: hypoxanthine phosphoribosyltransferase [Anaerolineales bacterium]|jgi:hypoxanthine phosphoribosyltransferase
MENESYKKFLAEVLITEEQINDRVRELGAEISKDFCGEELLLVCILRGGVIFLTDLMRYITIPHAIDFMAISSYGSGIRESTGTVRITMDLTTNIHNLNVLLVEDIVDSGRTIANVIEMLETRHPKSLYVCTLLDKTARRECEVPIHYAGFDIEDKFVFGYGLDLDEHYRNLPFIGVVDLNEYSPQE